MNRLGYFKRDRQINKSLKGKLNVSLKSKQGSGDFIEPIQPEEKSFTNLPEMAETEVAATNPDDTPPTFCEICLPYLYGIREPVIDYQEKRGISREESYTFCTMLMEIGNNMYGSVTALGAMLGNLTPLFDAVVLIFRFLLDKTIDIMEADADTRPSKIGIFVLEAIPIFFVVCFLWGFLLDPLYMLLKTVGKKFWHVIR